MADVDRPTAFDALVGEALNKVQTWDNFAARSLAEQAISILRTATRIQHGDVEGMGTSMGGGAYSTRNRDERNSSDRNERR